MCMEYLLAYRYVYMASIPCTCLVPEESRKGHRIPLELALRAIARHHVGAMNRTWVLCKNSEHS